MIDCSWLSLHYVQRHRLYICQKLSFSKDRTPCWALSCGSCVSWRRKTGPPAITNCFYFYLCLIQPWQSLLRQENDDDKCYFLNGNLPLVGRHLELLSRYNDEGPAVIVPYQRISTTAFSVTGSMTIIRNIWKTSSTWMRPVIQLAFLMNALGLAICTQIAKPFLGGNEQIHSNISLEATDNSTSDSVQTLYQLVLFYSILKRQD